MRLEDGNQTPRPERPRCSQRSRNLRGMMGIVVHNSNALRFSKVLKTTAHPGKVIQRLQDDRPFDPEGSGRTRRTQRVSPIMKPGKC
jgi:hypothetical protein